MKKALVTSMFFGAGFLLATAANAAITGSAHDFSSATWSSGQICITCHTPHNADMSVPDVPLWNHEVTQATFTLYSSGSLDAVVGQPGGVSKLCLSCHDGTVALDSFGGATGSTMLTGDANVGTDLSDDHPISFTYDTTLATTDGELHDPTTTGSGIGTEGNIDEAMLFGNGNDQLECASCHDVHNSYNIDSLLRKTNAGSALCITCHNK